LHVSGSFGTNIHRHRQKYCLHVKMNASWG
jgi:hypothetical protein